MSACFLIDLSLYRSVWWIMQCGCNTTQPPIAVGSVSLKEFLLFSFVFFCFAVSPFVRCSLSDGRLSVSGARVLGQGACLVSFFVFGDSFIFI